MQNWAFGIKPIDKIYGCKCGQVLGEDEYEAEKERLQKRGRKTVICKKCRSRFIMSNIFVCRECANEIVGYRTFTNHYIMHFIDKPKDEIPAEVRSYVKRQRSDIARRFGW